MNASLITILTKLGAVTLNGKREQNLHLIPHIPEEYFEKSFWASRLKPFIFQQLLQQHTDRNRTKRHIDAAIIILCVHFNEVLWDEKDPHYIAFTELKLFVGEADDKLVISFIGKLEEFSLMNEGLKDSAEYTKQLVQVIFGAPEEKDLELINNLKTEATVV